MFTRTGKKQSTPAIAHFECGLRTPNQAFVIGANAMIGIALAAIAYGMTPSPTRFHRASAIATTIAEPEPKTKPPSASLNVYQPECTSTCRLSQNVVAIADGRGSRNLPASGEKTHSQAAMPAAKTSSAGSQSPARRPTPRASAPRGSGSVTVEVMSPLPRGPARRPRPRRRGRVLRGRP